MLIQVYARSVYGRTLIYPANDAAQALARFANVRTFTVAQLRDLRAAGVNVVTVLDPRAAAVLPGAA